jgi:hypothetical protein
MPLAIVLAAAVSLGAVGLLNAVLIWIAHFVVHTVYFCVFGWIERR